jgi:hypothetical protein
MTKIAFTMIVLAALTSLARVSHADEAPGAPGATAPTDATTTSTTDAAPAAIALPPAPPPPFDPDHAPNDFELHVNGGMELTGGGGAFAAGFRGRVGIGRAFGRGSVRPAVAVGTMFGAGTISVDDPRSLDGSLDIHVRTYGPEAQVALRFLDGGSIDSRIFASAALLRTSMDSRLMYDRVPGVSGASKTGVRLSIGANWADRAIGTTILLPNQAELVYERDAGSNRYGVMLGWGI